MARGENSSGKQTATERYAFHTTAYLYGQLRRPANPTPEYSHGLLPLPLLPLHALPPSSCTCPPILENK
jgi:hypothetical protein